MDYLRDILDQLKYSGIFPIAPEDIIPQQEAAETSNESSKPSEEGFTGNDQPEPTAATVNDFEHQVTEENETADETADETAEESSSDSKKEDLSVSVNPEIVNKESPAAEAEHSVKLLPAGVQAGVETPKETLQIGQQGSPHVEREILEEARDRLSAQTVAEEKTEAAREVAAQAEGSVSSDDEETQKIVPAVMTKAEYAEIKKKFQRKRGDHRYKLTAKAEEELRTRYPLLPPYVVEHFRKFGKPPFQLDVRPYMHHEKYHGASK